MYPFERTMFTHVLNELHPSYQQIASFSAFALAILLLCRAFFRAVLALLAYIVLFVAQHTNR